MTVSRKQIEFIVLFTVIMTAVGLRFANLSAVRHNVDHAYPIWQAMTTLERGAFPIAGQQTSVLFANPALTGYLFIPALLATGSAFGVYVFVTLLNTVAIVFCHFTVKHLLHDWRLGIVAAWLMAVNPWVIEYSRTTWVQSLLPFFVCGVAWLLFPVLLGQSKQPQRRLIASLIAATLLTQTYLLAFLIIAPIVVLLIIFRRRVPVRGVVTGAAVFALATGVYAAGLLSNSGAVFNRVERFASGETRLKSEALTHAVRLVTGDQYAVARGASLPDTAIRQNLELIVHYGLLALLVMGIVLALKAMIRRESHRDTAIILLVWWVIPVAAMSYTGSPVHPFYQLLGLPAGFALAAWGAKIIITTSVGKIGFPVFLLAAGLLMGTNSLRHAEEIYLHPGEELSLGLPLGDGLKLGAEIDKNLPENGVIFSFFDPVILSSLTGRLVDVIHDNRYPDVSIIPAAGGVYLTYNNPGEPPPSLPYVTNESTITLADGYTLHMSVYPPSALDLTTIPDQLNIPSENGITFCCYTLRQNRRGIWTLTTYWSVISANPLISTDSFGMFAHIYNQQGERILNVDGVIIPGFHWRIGDIHIHRQRFEVPDEVQFTVQIGQYDPYAAKNVIFILPDGEYVPTLEIEGVETD